MRSARTVLLTTVVLGVTVLGTVSPAAAKPKPSDPTPWQTGMCSRMRQFVFWDVQAFDALRAIDPSASDDDKRLAIARTLQQIATAAGSNFHLDKLGALTVPKARAIQRDLQHELDRARKKISAAEAKAKRLTTPIDTAGPELRAIDADLTTGVLIYSDALRHVYGHTGDPRFDRAILANGECDFIAHLPTATSTA